MECVTLLRKLAVLPILFLLAGCCDDQLSSNVNRTGSRYEPKGTLPATVHPDETELAVRAVPTASEKVVWQWLDANIGSQERLSVSRIAQMQSGENVGSEVQVSSAENLLFMEQLNLLHAIKKSQDTSIARQYMLVHTLMTIGQAERTRSALSGDGPRRFAVLQQIKTAHELLAAIGYENHRSSSQKTGDLGK